MVSQSMGWQGSPLVPWEGISCDSGDTNSSPSFQDTGPSPCQLDVRFTRHKAAWIIPPCVQQPLQDLAPRLSTGSHSGKNFVAHAASPLRPSLLSLSDLAETSSSEDTTDSEGRSSAHGSGERSSSFSVASTEVLEKLPGQPQQASLSTGSNFLATSPSPEVDSAVFESSHLTASEDEGTVQDRRAISLSSFSPDVFVLPVDTEKENAHFYVVDIIISEMEKMKCSILNQRQTQIWAPDEASGSLGNDQADSEAAFYTHMKQESGSSASSDSGYEGKLGKGCAVLQASPMAEAPSYHNVPKEASKCDLDEFVILELGEFNDIIETHRCSCSSSTSGTYDPDFNSAERLARELYRVFQKCWMFSVVNYQLAGSPKAASSIVVNEEHVQKDFESGMDVQEIKLNSRTGGTEDWVPPRFQIVFDIHPPLTRELGVVSQNFFCAGCGTPIEPKFVKRLRYCEYLGKYFCDGCHSYSESCIPARILMLWDFRKYHVSNFSKQLLNHIWHQPIFNLPSISHSLSTKAKELDRVKDIQEQLFHIKKLLKTCRFADSVLKEFEQVPQHLTDELHLFSLEDLVRTKRGLLAPLLRDILKASLAHIASCELCQGKGFICEFCRSTTVIFPFQTATCKRCSACRACFHKHCFQSSGCPRCARITARRRLLESLPLAAT
ncbi:hypothetical protein GW7_16594 [Heterocephalus glaber]|uniref:Rubicon Homology domain-containing protein n=1 Tax=Heterocephalus glaber TaxID=10181 RepID=G5C1E8_HETGA|nr:hypothetical protein GW7_16594 [Heterocephalus glaber]